MQKLLQILFVICCFTFAATAQDRTVSGMVSDKDGALAGVNVKAKNASNATSTDADGKFSLRVPASTTTLVVSFIGMATQEVAIPASGVVNVTMSTDASQLGEVVISVGSRNTQRTITDTPLPIDIVGAKDLQATGQTTFDKALQYRVPSFNTVQTPVNDATSLLDPYEIRNMGPSRTLILINGKRKNLSSLVYIQTSPGRGESGADISAIPTEAIKRVEILRDGASAQYGSDAIAGVMNIILKDKYDYGSVTFNTGFAQNTNAGDFKVGDKYQDKVKPFDGRTFGVTINNGSNVGSNGFINYTVALSTVGLTNRPGKVSAAAEASADLGFEAPIADVKKFLAKYPDAGNVNGAPETTSSKFCVNGGQKLGENTDFYYNAAYVYKRVNSYANYRTPYWRTTSTPGWQLYAPDGTAASYEGYVPGFEGDLNDYNATVGFRSKIGEWTSDASFTTGGNTQAYTVSNSRNRSLGVTSPILFKPGGYSFSHNVGNIDISRPIMENLNFAFGTEFRAEKFNINASKDTASYVGKGADSFPGITPNNGGEFTRFNIGAYVDLAYDITKDFLINATARTEKYSDFGNANVYKVSTRYKALDDKITVRGSYSTGFRAPTLHQINQQIAQASFVPGQGIQTKGIVNNRSSQAKLLGVPNLKAEKSNNVTVGLGFNPTKNFSLTLDYYSINVKDRIVLGSEISKVADPKPGQPALTAGQKTLNSLLDANGIVAVSFFVNALSTKTSGLDLVASYRGLDLASGKLNVSLAGNYQLENALDVNSTADVDGVQDGINNPALIAKAGKSVFDKTQEALLLSSRPKFKGILGLDYSVGKFSVSLNNTLFGSTRFHQNGLDDKTDTEFTPAIVTDLGLAYELTSKATLRLNVNNLLNVYPKWNFVDIASGKKTKYDASRNEDRTNPYFDQFNLITFDGRYSTVTYDGSQFSQLGRMFNVALNVKF
jgi:iron complex outermembrane recepter protein